MPKKIVNKLKDMSMDLHELEMQIFKENIDETGQFNTPANQILFVEIGKTRKQVEQLLYVVEKYKLDK